ncbi:MAG: nucleoside recognition protein [Spirochaetes bacterium RIFOXYC1_FULL_54_7]|nr:MAG: nucleoside recognition protein [Spirochaetes bacterium RIFOXYC1_FULL_54_7]
MINYVWFGLIAIGTIVGFATGNIQAITDGAINAAKTAIDLSFGLIGIMAMWLGIMAIADEAGLVKKLAHLMKPLMSKLFPDVPPDHPALGNIVLNIAANMIGLGNAATPIGLKAFKELQSLNSTTDTATNAMCTFMAINTSQVQIIAATTVALRVAAGATNPTDIIGATLLATTISTAVGIIAVKLFEKLPKNRASCPAPLANLSEGA